MADKEEQQEKLNSVLTGVSGEYFVAAELSRQGMLASITLRNTKGVDILCSNGDATKSVGIQVKTNKGSNRAWIMHKKAEDFYAKNLFYIFVNLNNNKKSPDYFIVPSKKVAKFTKEGYTAWRARPGRGGRMHRDTSIRQFSDPKKKYLNKWDLLGLKPLV